MDGVEFRRVYSMKDTKSLMEFHSNSEYVQAMVEDLCDWLNFIYPVNDFDKLHPSNFFNLLKNGVILCKHANMIQTLAEEYLQSANKKSCDRKLPMKIGNQYLTVPVSPPKYSVVDFTKVIYHYHERDNVSNFISWCRQLNIPMGLTFETDDLVSLKNRRSFVVCLLEVARIGGFFGVEVPDIIQMEKDIENELNDNQHLSELSLSNTNEITKPDECETVSTDGNSFDVTPVEERIKIRSRPFGLHSNFGCSNKRICSAVDITTQGDDNSYLMNNESPDNENFCEFSLSNTNEITKPDEYKTESTDGNSFDVTPVEERSKIRSRPFGLHSNFGCSNKRICSAVDITNQGDDNSYLMNNESPDVVQFNSMKSDGYDSEDSFMTNETDNVLTIGGYMIPKYKTKRPVGRVKIYDCFDNIDNVRRKKVREKVDLRTLDERVRDVLSQCQCDETFPMKKVSEGRYQFGEKNTLIFLRILRNHVMVRVGGGWDTLTDFLRKHDPCRKCQKEAPKFYLPTKLKEPLLKIGNTHIASSFTCPAFGNMSEGFITFRKKTNKCIDHSDKVKSFNCDPKTDNFMKPALDMPSFNSLDKTLCDISENSDQSLVDSSRLPSLDDRLNSNRFITLRKKPNKYVDHTDQLEVPSQSYVDNYPLDRPISEISHCNLSINSLCDIADCSNISVNHSNPVLKSSNDDKLNHEGNKSFCLNGIRNSRSSSLGTIYVYGMFGFRGGESMSDLNSYVNGRHGIKSLYGNKMSKIPVLKLQNKHL